MRVGCNFIMTYIITKSDKLEFHTDLKNLLKPILSYIANYNWLLTNQDYLIYDYDQKGGIKQLNFEDKKIKFSGIQFSNMVTERNVQFVWGVFCAFNNEIPNIKLEELPFADCNPNIWEKPLEFLNEESEIEIICFDGTSTIIKFKDKEIEKKFVEYFPEAKLLTK